MPEAAAMVGAPADARPGSAVGRAIRALFSFRVMLATGLAVIAVSTVSNRFSDPDLWWHLKMGQILWSTHSIPPTDTFSYTAYGQPWIPHEWLAQLSIYAAYHYGGYPGLMLWFSALSSALVVLAYYLCYLVTEDPLVAFLGAICTWFFATIGLALRPLLLGYSFLLIELILLELAARNRRWLWLLPPLFGVWVNCHGSYFFGILVLSIHWICSHLGGRWGLLASERWDKRDRHLLTIILILSVVALCCNPVGIRLLFYPLNVAFKQSASMNGNDEWLPTDLRNIRGIGLLLAFFGVSVIPLLRRTELRLRDLLVSGVAFALAAQHVRMLFVFGIVVSPALCRAATVELNRRPKRDHPMANAAFISALVILMIWAFPRSSDLQEQIRKQNPSGAVNYIRREKLSGPMLNEYVFGDYLIWALPEHKVFIDGRGDIFDWSGVLSEYGGWATLSADPGILLGKYGVRFCLLSTQARMTRVMPYLPGWQKAYSDDVATVFVRR